MPDFFEWTPTASKQYHVLFLVTRAFLVSSGNCLSISGSELMEIILRTEAHVDLFFHCLAHMDIGPDASSLYSQAYLSWISREKIQNNVDFTWLTGEMNKIKDIYILDQKLRMVNFLSFQFANVEQILEGLKWLSGEEDRGFLAGFPQTELENLLKARVSPTEKTVQMLEIFIRNSLNSQESSPGMQMKMFGRQPMTPGNFRKRISCNETREPHDLFNGTIRSKDY